MSALSRTKQVAFITVAGHSIGMGHLSRCRLLKKFLEPGCCASLVVFCDERSRILLSSEDEASICFPMTSLSPNKFSKAIEKHITVNHIVIVDFVHTHLWADTPDPAFIFEELQNRAKTVVAIDALGMDTLARRLPNAEIDTLIVPYVVSEAEAEIISSTGKGQLVGPDYALLPGEFSNVGSRKILPCVSSLLLTCGGSDPGQYSLVCLDALSYLSEPLDVRIVIGPLFSEELKIEIYRRQAESHHRVVLLEAPESLFEHMLWCDVAVSTSGLTKYELAATGTPAILFSINKEHALANEAFAKLGSCALDLGSDATPETIASALKDLCSSFETRQKLSNFGQKMIDGKGVLRLVSAIGKDNL